MMQAAEEFFADLEETSEHVSGPPLTDGGVTWMALPTEGARQRRRVIRAEDCLGTGEWTEGAVDGLRWVGMRAGLLTTF
jgi:hypothetical protein